MNTHTTRALGRLALFVGGAAGVIIASVALAAFAVGTLNIQVPNAAALIAGALGSAGLLLVSWRLLRAEQSGIGTLGLTPTRRRLREFALGFAVTAPLFLGVAMLQSRMVGAGWEFQGLGGVRVAIAGVAATSVLVLFEELLFRGMGLRLLAAALGQRVAVVLSAVCFGAYHLVGSEYWAMGAVFQFLMPTLGGLVFGWAAIRSGGLALPLGLHLGGNWIQAWVAGFAPIGSQDVTAVWRIPITASDLQTLTAPDVGVRWPFLLALALTVVLIGRYRALADSVEPLK